MLTLLKQLLAVEENYRLGIKDIFNSKEYKYLKEGNKLS